MNIVALNAPLKTAAFLKKKKGRKFIKTWLLLERPRCSFIGLEPTPACIATTGNGVAGDLYNSVYSRWGMTADRERQPVSKIVRGGGSFVICRFDIPGRTNQAAPVVSHPAVIMKGPFLVAGTTLPLLSHALFPAMTFHHHLPARAERLHRQMRVWSQNCVNCQQQSLYENQWSSLTKWSMKRGKVGFPTFQQLNYIQNSLFCLSVSNWK